MSARVKRLAGSVAALFLAALLLGLSDASLAEGNATMCQQWQACWSNCSQGISFCKNVGCDWKCDRHLCTEGEVLVTCDIFP